MRKTNNNGHVIVVSTESKFYLRFRKFIIYKDTYDDKPLLRILNMNGNSCGFIIGGDIPHETLHDNYQKYIVMLDAKTKYPDGINVELYENEKIYVMKVYDIKVKDCL